MTIDRVEFLLVPAIYNLEQRIRERWQWEPDEEEDEDEEEKLKNNWDRNRIGLEKALFAGRGSGRTIARSKQELELHGVG